MSEQIFLTPLEGNSALFINQLVKDMATKADIPHNYFFSV